jgi:hypothetical protein
VMMMAMAFTRCIAILWKGFGLAYAISCVPFEVFTKSMAQ